MYVQLVEGNFGKYLSAKKTLLHIYPMISYTNIGNKKLLFINILWYIGDTSPGFPRFLLLLEILMY